MKTTFRIENKDFSHQLKLTAGGKEYYFNDELTIEYDECETLEAELELIHALDYFRMKAKNILWKLLYVVFWLVGLISYLSDCDRPGVEQGYSSFDPFTVKKAFSIPSPEGKVVLIRYKEAQYSKETKQYTPSELLLDDPQVIVNEEAVLFSPAVYRREWRLCHIPAYTVFGAVTLFIAAVTLPPFLGRAVEIITSSLAENWGELLAMGFCCFVVVGLFVMLGAAVAKSVKLYRRVLGINSR